MKPRKWRFQALTCRSCIPRKCVSCRLPTYCSNIGGRGVSWGPHSRVRKKGGPGGGGGGGGGTKGSNGGGGGRYRHNLGSPPARSAAATIGGGGYLLNNDKEEDTYIAGKCDRGRPPLGGRGGWVLAGPTSPQNVISLKNVGNVIKVMKASHPTGLTGTPPGREGGGGPSGLQTLFEILTWELAAGRQAGRPPENSEGGFYPLPNPGNFFM